MQEESLREKLSAIMKANNLSQGDVAKAANISQSTISRALTRPLQRQTDARKRLCKYMQQFQGGAAAEGKDKAIEAFETIWNRSEPHARAIAAIIKATVGLLPTESEGERI
jgi:transcriptional regulator with XRE-family HTH domain